MYLIDSRYLRRRKRRRRRRRRRRKWITKVIRRGGRLRRGRT